MSFAGPGLFNALQGLGNAGGSDYSDPQVAAAMNAMLYASFAVFMSGCFFNIIGKKYVCYAMLCYAMLCYVMLCCALYLFFKQYIAYIRV